MKKILIVEDEVELANNITEALSDLDYKVSAIVDNAASALAFLEENEVDLVLMDISLKGDEDGLSLTRRLRAEEDFKKLPIIAVTANAFPDDRMRAMKAGCTDYLPKPVSSNDLYRKITEFTR